MSLAQSSLPCAFIRAHLLFVVGLLIRRLINLPDDVPLLLLVTFHSVVGGVQTQPSEHLLRASVDYCCRFPQNDRIALLKFQESFHRQVAALDSFPIALFLLCFNSSGGVHIANVFHFLHAIANQAIVSVLEGRHQEPSLIVGVRGL